MDALDSLVNFTYLLSNSSLPVGLTDTESNQDNTHWRYCDHETPCTDPTGAPVTIQYFRKVSTDQTPLSMKPQRERQLEIPEHKHTTQIQTVFECYDLYSVNGGRSVPYVCVAA
jgi:hypothetical protein